MIEKGNNCLRNSCILYLTQTIFILNENLQSYCQFGMATRKKHTIRIWTLSSRNRKEWTRMLNELVLHFSYWGYNRSSGYSMSCRSILTPDQTLLLAAWSSFNDQLRSFISGYWSGTWAEYILNEIQDNELLDVLMKLAAVLTKRWNHFSDDENCIVSPIAVTYGMTSTILNELIYYTSLIQKATLSQMFIVSVFEIALKTKPSNMV